MPSPFPGMNPYLEQPRVWHDFHERFMPLAAELIGAQLDPNYIVKIDEHVYIHELPTGARHLAGHGDAAVTRLPGIASAGPATALCEAPARVRLPLVDMERLSYVEIRDRDNWQLVTVIELLSPSNKALGPDREQYLAKRLQLLNSAVHVVELDLLRGGPRLPLEDLPPCDYYAMVSRMGERPHAGIWPLLLRDPLPEIPIPLRSPHADVSLPLQTAVHRIYEVARYHLYLYQNEPQPRLGPDDAAWAQQFLPAPN